jgi:hypothetical protein
VPLVPRSSAPALIVVAPAPGQRACSERLAVGKAETNVYSGGTRLAAGNAGDRPETWSRFRRCRSSVWPTMVKRFMAPAGSVLLPKAKPLAAAPRLASAPTASVPASMWCPRMRVRA